MPPPRLGYLMRPPRTTTDALQVVVAVTQAQEPLRFGERRKGGGDVPFGAPWVLRSCRTLAKRPAR